MNDRLSTAKDFSPIDSRANLFYFLRIMSGTSQIGGLQVGVDSVISSNQVAMRQNVALRDHQDRLAL